MNTLYAALSHQTLAASEFSFYTAWTFRNRGA